MKICKRCLYPENHPLHLIFDEHGVCSGCRVHEEKEKLDWKERSLKLKNILENYKNTSGNNYDCIIPVSGGRDSYFIVHVVKNIYKMNPLLVTYNKQYNTETGIRNLANLKIRFNCDLVSLTVNPEKVKKITRATLLQMGSMYWHCIAGQTVFPVQVAVKFKIPLIIFGAHQGIDQVGMFSHTDEVEMTRKYRHEHDLMGFEAEDLVNKFDEITEEDITQYKYPDDKEIEQVSVRGIYLNNYIHWDSFTQHEEMVKMYGFEGMPQNRTFDSYNDADCFNYSDVHDYIKYIKWGYSKVTDHVCREIRLRKMSREEGIRLIKEFCFKEPIFLNQFLEWIGMTKNGFNYIIDQHRNKNIWARNEHWKWEIIDAPHYDDRPDLIKAAALPLKNIDIPLNYDQYKINSEDDKYILIGKGYKK